MVFGKPTVVFYQFKIREGALRWILFLHSFRRYLLQEKSVRTEPERKGEKEDRLLAVWVLTAPPAASHSHPRSGEAPNWRVLFDPRSSTHGSVAQEDRWTEVFLYRFYILIDSSETERTEGLRTVTQITFP